MKKLCLVISLAGALWATSAQAAMQWYDVSFVDPTAQNIAHGLISVDMVDGVAVSGTMTVLNGFAVGTYNLIATTTPGLTPYSGFPNAFYSPSGAFYFDDKIVGIPPGPPALPFVDLAGLAFTGTGARLNTEINLFSDNNGANAYAFYGWTPSVGYDPAVHGGAAIGLSAVPEPTTMIAGALLLLPFGASTLRIVRKKRAV
jgi:hypothetical protein